MPPSNVVSHLCGRDSIALDAALTSVAMCVDLNWVLKVRGLCMLAVVFID